MKEKNLTNTRKIKRIVTVGGGTGTFVVTKGLRPYNISLTAVCSTLDSGGNTGVLRDEHGALPSGDIRRGMIALADNDTLRELFNYRFPNGHSSAISDYSLGNLILLAAEKLWGPLDGISKLSDILDLEGKVLPVSIDDSNVLAELSDGSLVKGEGEIDNRDPSDSRPIKKIWLEPTALICRPAAEAIEDADLIVLGPGDLYTSIVPNLLVKGVAEAIKNSKGKLVYISNLMTKPAETRGYTLLDFVEHLFEYGVGREKFDAILRNDAPIPATLIESYRKHDGSEPVLFDQKIAKSLTSSVAKVIEGDFVSDEGFSQGLIRHDSGKLARALMTL